MNRTTTIGLVITLGLAGCSESSAPAPAEVTTEARTMEVGCGSCIYDMAGVEGCVIAAKVDGTPMLVTGVEVDAHDHGLCSTSKQALIAGKVEGGEFVATSFEIQ